MTFVLPLSVAIGSQEAIYLQNEYIAEAAAGGSSFLQEATVAESGLALIDVSVRVVVVAVTDAVLTGNYQCFPIGALPAGFAVVDSVCVTAGQLSISILVPPITGAYSIPVRVVQLLTP